MIPLQPNSPGPRFGGMNAPAGLVGVTQLPVRTNHTPATMKTTTMATLITTMAVLMRADSCTPTTSSAVTAMMTAIAGTLSTASVACQTPCAASYANGA